MVLFLAAVAAVGRFVQTLALLTLKFASGHGNGHGLARSRHILSPQAVSCDTIH